MNNLQGLTAFIRLVKSQVLGFSTPYLVPEGDDYSATVNKLNAIAGREQVKISTSPLFIVDSSSLKTLQAIKITRK